MSVYCTYCGKSFTKEKHLERHILTHTNVRPFTCSACHLSFARSDRLKRHFVQHHGSGDISNQENASNGAGMQAPVPIACTNCSKSKLSCDKTFPCGRCAAKSIPCDVRYTQRSMKVAPQPPQDQADFSSMNTSSNSMISSGESIIFPRASTVNLTSPAKNPRQSVDLGYTSLAHLTASSSNLQQATTAIGAGFALNGVDDLNTDRNGHAGHNLNDDLMSWIRSPLNFDSTAAPAVTRAPEDMNMSTSFNTFANITDGQSLMLEESPQLSPNQPRFNNGPASVLTPPRSDLTNSTELHIKSIPELEPILASQDAWPIGRCNPPIYSGSCPRTAILHLEGLEQKLNNDGVWNILEINADIQDLFRVNQLSFNRLAGNTRDKILAIAQSFLHKALEIHRGGTNRATENRYPFPGSPGHPGFMILPPSSVLDYFLGLHVSSSSCYYNLTPGGIFDPNELMRKSNDRASSLLMLLMIALGAVSIPTVEARYLTGGLTETCRISLYDCIEKDVELCANLDVLHCALLATMLGAWSGDKWHMDIAIGQRGMYIAMLKHAGLLENKEAPSPTSEDRLLPDPLWKSWQEYEIRNRLVYNWVMVDQELSLFYDTAPLLSITDLTAPLPDAECLWFARNATEWMDLHERRYGPLEDGSFKVGTQRQDLSLYSLFQHLLHDEIAHHQIQLSPLHLRLLLHPIQSLSCHLRQVLSCLSDSFGSRKANKTVTKASLMVRLEEVQSLLQQWYDLSLLHTKNDLSCSVTRSNLVLFHLTSLNTVTYFPAIEKLARKEGLNRSYWHLSWTDKEYIQEPEVALFHSGQVIRILQQMPIGARPSWWPAAIYRVSMVLWTYSMTHMAFPKGGEHEILAFRLDGLAPEHPSVAQYLRNREGLPVLTRRDGQLLSLDNGSDVLCHCLELLDQGVPTRLSSGFRNKLQKLMENWKNGIGS